MVTKEECQQACLYLLSHCYETDKKVDIENGDEDEQFTFTSSGFEESKIFKQLIEEHFNNSLDFKYFKPYSDSYLYHKISKKDLIKYIHMLYYNWQACDSWWQNTVKENEKLLEEKSKLLDNVCNYKFENHCMKLTIRNLCDHFGVKDIKELQQIYLKEKENSNDN